MKNYYCKRRAFLVYVFIIVADCLPFLFLNFFLSFNKCPILMHEVELLRCPRIGRQVVSVGWEKGK